jgi:hypothetical protein
MVRHRFTPAQANKTLPLVRRIVTDILRTGRELRAFADSDLRGDTLVRYRRRRGELRELIEELERIGCTYKDWGFDAGLVDFPAEIDGEKVLLCWRSDEESVSWYHTYEGGFSGRQPIPEELLER